MRQREPHNGRDGGSEHIVQLFDSRRSLVTAVAAFLREGLEKGDRILVVMSSENRSATIGCLPTRELDQAVADGRFTVLDTADTLGTFMQDGVLRRDLFQTSVGTMVTRLASLRGRLRIYGEMVNLLAAEGDFRNAHQLEELWNELRERASFTLFCGYSAAAFGDPDEADSLQLICRAHSQVRVNPRDQLASFLLDSRLNPIAKNARIADITKTVG